MYEWQQQIQLIVNEIDQGIKNHDDEALTLRGLSDRLGYSEFYTTRKFREISGMSFRDYLRNQYFAREGGYHQAGFALVSRCGNV